MTWKSDHLHADALSGRRVLIVEDEPLIALELRTVLTDEGAQVVGPGRDLAESLALASKAGLSAALLDVRLGGETVAPLAQALNDRGVPFAFYTGQTETDLVRQQWPAAPVVAKPSPGRDLVAVVEGLCARGQSGGSALVAGGGLEPPTCGL